MKQFAIAALLLLVTFVSNAIAAAPVDFGPGPGLPALKNDVVHGSVGKSGGAPASVASLSGDTTAHIKGVFGPAFAWPVVPIHQVLLPDGRVMTYGTNLQGNQGAILYYVVWNPALGTSTAAFTVLDNVTHTDLFCGAQLVLPNSGEVILMGGDRTDIYGRRNNGNSDINYYSPATNTIRKDAQGMGWGRWYATSVTTSLGEVAVMGGRDNAALKATNIAPAQAVTYTQTPEVYSPTLGLRALTNALSDEAYGSIAGSWNYPRAWLAPNGHIFILAHSGKMFDLDPAGAGILMKYATKLGTDTALPGVMFAPGKILSLRDQLQVAVIDINGTVPVIQSTSTLSEGRRFGNATLLADGKVFINGGSTLDNVLAGAVYSSLLWNPQSADWTTAATAAKPRLYHSSAMLLPDATVLTGGGGAPGPVVNLNSEIYYPPYLFKQDGSGELAPRPGIVSAPTNPMGWGEIFSFNVSADTTVGRVTLMRTGSVTHAFNNEQRVLDLSFTQSGTSIELHTPEDHAAAPPGFYLLFVFDAAGVPSVARVIWLKT